MEKQYTFNFNLADTELVFSGIKKLPFEVAERLVASFVMQYQFQVQNQAPTFVDAPVEVSTSDETKAEEVQAA